jgi:hypothetical protein
MLSHRDETHPEPFRTSTPPSPHSAGAEPWLFRIRGCSQKIPTSSLKITVIFGFLHRYLCTVLILGTDFLLCTADRCVGPSGAGMSAASARSAAAGTSAQEFASAAEAASADTGIAAREARRDTIRHVMTTAGCCKVARTARLRDTAIGDFLLGGITPRHLHHHRHCRRRRRRSGAVMALAPCQGCPRHAEVQPLRAACGRSRVHSIRGSSLLC